jgi:hypothetical protein
VVIGVRYIYVAGIVGGDAFGLEEDGGGGGDVLAYPVAAGDGGDGVVAGSEGEA